jgi:anti-anti-sigma factor
MQLTLQRQKVGDVLVVRCQGRIVAGEEIRSLQFGCEEVPRQACKVVLNLAEVSFIDSAGVGALVRLLGVMRAHGGDLKLCELSPFVARVLQITNLLGTLLSYASEQEAIQAFHEAPQFPKESSEPAKARIVCTDSSNDLLSYLSALLTRSGYEVFTTRHTSDAVTLALVTRPRVVICGPGVQTNEFAMDRLRNKAPNMRLLLLPADFSTTDAGQAGTNLLEQVRSLLASQP